MGFPANDTINLAGKASQPIQVPEEDGGSL